MPIVGSFAGASARAYGLQAGGAIGDFESIASTTVGSGGATNVTFSSIPATYTHLQIRGIARSTAANTDINIEMQFNADTGSNYSLHGLYGTGSSAVSYNATSTNSNYVGRITGASSTASIFGVMVVDILDYANTNKFKTVRSLTGHDQNGSGLVFFNSGNWRSTSAITSIKLYSGLSGNLAQYSSFQLYGVKA